jgi:hypothetical protein
MILLSETIIEIIERTYGEKSSSMSSSISNKVTYKEREVYISGELLFKEKFKYKQHLSNNALDELITLILKNNQ